MPVLKQCISEFHNSDWKDNEMAMIHLENEILSKIFWVSIFTIMVFSVPHLSAYGQTLSGYYDVKHLGANGNGSTYDTQVIQNVIDSANVNGGGVVYFPPGKYLIKTLKLKENITLHIERGATILGSTELYEFDPELGAFKDSGGKKFGTALIFAKDVHNIGIKGEGTINGQGYEKFYPKKEGVYRPSLIRFIRCRSVKVEDVTLLNSAAWVQHYVDCEDLTIQGITVRSYSNKNNDGLDIESCRRVNIQNCTIDTEDDSIVLKALSNKPCQDIVISDCIISGLKSAIKTGTESLGGFENIVITNCAIYGTRGISLISVDGGDLNGITISNITMRDSYAVIVMRLGQRMRGYSVPESERPTKPGKFKNIMINNIQALGVTESNDFISGIPGYFIENVTLTNIRVEYAGGGKKSDSFRVIPEIISEYPKAKMFGVLPSYGMFIRHAKNITLRDVQFTYLNNDLRSALVCDDTQNIQIDNLQAQSSASSAPLLVFNDAKGVRILNSKSLNPADTFAMFNGNSGDIEFFNNVLNNVQKKFEFGAEIFSKDIIRIKD